MSVLYLLIIFRSTFYTQQNTILRLQYRSCYICMFSNTFNYCYIFVYVVVQFYPWFNFYLPLFYTRYHTLLYTKTN